MKNCWFLNKIRKEGNPMEISDLSNGQGKGKRPRLPVRFSKARWLTFGLVVLQFLAIIVLIQFYNNAEARRIAALAEIELMEDRPHIATILTLQSLEIANTYAGQKMLMDLYHKVEPSVRGQILTYDDVFFSTAWSADGVLASGGGGEIYLWDLTTGEPAQILYGHSTWVSSLAWSPDGRLASGSEDGKVIIWDLATGQPALVLEGHQDSVTTVAWSDDGELASGSTDNTIILWDLTNGLPRQTLTGHSDWVFSVAWSHDGRLVSGSSDDTVIIWDLASGQPAQILTGHSGAVFSVAWSRDGKLASGSNDNTVIIWDLASGQPAQILIGHSDSVLSVAWSHDGRLASGSFDNIVLVWDQNAAAPDLKLYGHDDPVNDLAWSPDGKLASAGTLDSMVIVWAFDNERAEQFNILDFSEDPCPWVLRNLTVDEWSEYIGVAHNYKPACPNLPSEEIPALWEILTDFDDLGYYLLVDATGKIFVLLAVVTILTICGALIFLPLWGCFKLIKWIIRRRTKKVNETVD